MTISRIAIGLAIALALGACAVVPPAGPSILAVPGQGKDLAAFYADDVNCRNHASAQIGFTTPAQAGNDAALGSAFVGTVVGAGAGALIGAASGAAGPGAAIGAGVGLLAGSAVGVGNAQATAGELQQRYDMAYAQCITITGNTVRAPAFMGVVPAPYPYAVPAYPAPVVYAYPYATPYRYPYAYRYPRYGHGWYR